MLFSRKTGFLIFGRETGFTLVEVLVAGIILFSVLGAGTIVYRTSLVLKEKITLSAIISQALPSIMQNVKMKIRENETQGYGYLNDTITYRWQNRSTRSLNNAISARDEFGGSTQYGDYIIHLNDVLLAVTYKKDLTEREEQYEYKELSWTKR